MRFKKFSFYSDGKGNSKTATGNGKIQSPTNKVKRDISPHRFKSNSLHLDKMQATENIWSPTQTRERRVSQNNDFLMNSITTSTTKKKELFSKRSPRELLGKLSKYKIIEVFWPFWIKEKFKSFIYFILKCFPRNQQCL